MKNIAIIGSGSWGVALSIHLAGLGNNVKIWSFAQEEADLINNDRKCKFLPNIIIPNNIMCSLNYEEVIVGADLILHVIDATNSNYELQKSTTEKVLKELGADTKPTILVYNKIDRLELDIYPKNHDDIVYISAKKGINMDKLIEIIQDNIMKNTYAVTLMLPYERGDIFSRLKNKYNIENFEYVESGITLDVNLEEEDYNIYKEYILEK